MNKNFYGELEQKMELEPFLYIKNSFLTSNLKLLIMEHFCIKFMSYCYNVTLPHRGPKMFLGHVVNLYFMSANVATCPNSSIILSLSTGWIMINFCTAQLVNRSTASVLF